MVRKVSDPSLDELLFLDGTVLVVDPDGRHWVKIAARRVPPTPEKPHGVDYSLTLHDAAGNRLVGFDNAHPVTRRRKGQASATSDHRHRRGAVAPYVYRSAADLLTDFWTEVGAVLKERGVPR